MKLDFNFNLIGLDGKEIENENVGKTLARNLSSVAEGDSLKFMDWARKIYNGTELDLDPSDVQTLKAFVEKSQYLNNLSKSMILEVINKANK